MRVGVVGAGQLGRMLGLAGIPLGCSFTFLDPAGTAGARAVGDLITARYDDDAALAELAEASDVVTYEFENVPSDAARRIARRVPVFPPPRALEMTQDRAREKELFASCGIATAAYELASNQEEVDRAVASLGFPAVVKTRREGYDGKGQEVVRAPSDASGVVERLGGRPLLVEKLIGFERELSIIAVRGRDGEVVTYPLVENRHHEGILRLSRAPATGTEQLQEQANRAIRGLLDELGHVGVLTLELFDAAGSLVANELAPRVHNSGHWTIEGAETSQFENHLRAIVGLPLGSTGARGHSAMVNLVGDVPPAADVLRVPGTHLHLYDKERRPGRKVGHITIRADDRARVNEALDALRGTRGTHVGANGSYAGRS